MTTVLNVPFYNVSSVNSRISLQPRIEPTSPTHIVGGLPTTKHNCFSSLRFTELSLLRGRLPQECGSKPLHVYGVVKFCV